MVFLEEATQHLSPLSKTLTALAAILLPSGWLRFLWSHERPTPESLAAVIFSSGSTGMPKGVMLSHHNILSSIEGISQIFRFTRHDLIMGVLPFFHSFGFTGTLWLPVIAGFGAAFHSNPTDARTVGEMILKHKATILISTPTFYSAYLRRCTAEEFSSLRYAVAGAEKLREPLAKAFKEKFGLELLEGYGCTEMAPVVALNVPDVDHGPEHQTGLRPGTVGHPIPGVAVKVVEPDTWEPLPHGRQGLLLVKGPNRMIGYLGQPEKTREVLKDGWYITGDIASMDEDGFLKITDRLSRFSKIAGEMVSHLKVEEAINHILGEDASVVLSLPDERKGERLVVLHTKEGLTPDEVWNGLSVTDLPKLWIPRKENIHCVPSLPILGTGKVDLRRAREIALDKTATA
jgi:acyl-[acyl-carrier-protein]-phospholipid O-acyltransferase/long-chain-fatty-acid--[acyl-carrier-protein] ligase